MIRIWLGVPAIAAALMFCGATTSVTKPPPLVGSSGKGGAFVITFRYASGKKVKTLKAGRYQLVIRDYSKRHNFHLKGPGLNVRSFIPFVGRLAYSSLVFKRGTYRFWCDAHRSRMHGSFKVAS